MSQTRIRRKKALLVLLGLTALALGLFLIFTIWLIRTGLPGNIDFYLHQRRYESIVAHAKALPLAPGAETHTTWDGLKVDVGRNQSGSYTVTITTVDWHHAGVYGYVFSDLPLTPHPNEQYPESQSIDNPGDMPFVDKSIVRNGGHWWSVYNNLN